MWLDSTYLKQFKTMTGNAVPVFSRLGLTSTSAFWDYAQGCPQDVKSQDRDETETVNLQDRDETETFHFYKLN